MDDREPEAREDSGSRDIVAARRRHILELAHSEGRVMVDDLAERLSVTTQTIRKDLNHLAERNILSRVHGGAVVTSGVDNIAYELRRRAAAGAKAAIGSAAAALIPNGASLLINIGTTTEAVAEKLGRHRDLMVISNNLNVVDLLNGNSAIEMIAVGGKIRRSDRAAVGALAMEFIRNFRVDYAVIGVSAIDEGGTLLDFDIDEVEVSRMIVRNARQVILVADSSKIGRAAPVRIGDFADIDYFVTNRLPHDHGLRAICAAHDVELIEVEL